MDRAFLLRAFSVLLLFSLSCSRNDSAGMENPATGLSAYIANLNANTVVRCPILEDGTFASCVNSGGVGFSSPYDIVFNSAGTFAYVTNTPGTVSVCPVLENRSFGTCFDSGALFTSANGITLNTANTFAYVANGDSVWACPINPDGSFGTCVDSGAGPAFNVANGIAINPAGTFAYVADFPSNVQICSIDLSGTFSGCADSQNTGLPFQGPNFLTINAAGTFAYVPNRFPGYSEVLICPIGVDGAYGECIESAGDFLSPQKTILTSTSAYITDSGFNQILKCELSLDGNFSACSELDDAAFDGPYGIAFF